MAAKPQPARDKAELKPAADAKRVYGGGVVPCTETSSISEPRETVTAGPSREPLLAHGDVLERRFFIVKLLGSGGMGEVYEAEDRLRPDRPHVALKTIRADLVSDEKMLERFQQEVSVAQSVTHPNVCPVREIFSCPWKGGQIWFLTMKLLQGETLGLRLKQGRLEHEQALRIAREIGAGLDAIHQFGFVHRDLKPSNVFLEKCPTGERAVVMDFGIAHVLTEESVIRTQHVPGTPPYMAPELLAGRSATPRSDVYSFGVVLHEMLIGSRPDSARTLDAAAAPEDTKTRRFRGVISRCLAHTPERRFASAGAVVSALEAACEEPGLITRRRLIAGAATAVVGTAAWRERSWIDNLLHPLPQKRFVALVEWPPIRDAHMKPLVAGVIDGIENELSRAEAFDRDLFVISHRSDGEDREAVLMKDVRDSLGANLVLTACGDANTSRFRMRLHVVDTSTTAVLRSREFASPLDELNTITSKAVQLAAELLNVRLTHARPFKPGTESASAYNAFEAAEDLMKQPNDAGLDAALEKYKEALDADPRFAVAYAKLAMAYIRVYGLRSDPAALDLARRNCETALKLDENSVEAHLALSSTYENTGNPQKALSEISRALALDPGNPRTLVWQAEIYRRINHWHEAEEIYRRVLKERPNYWLAYNEIGGLLNAQGKYQEAIQAFRAATLALPRSALAFNNLGAIYLKLGDFGRAEQNFRKSVDLKPNDLAYSNTATALRAQGKQAEALSLYLKAVELNPSDDQNWQDLGDAYASFGKQKQAREAYSRAADEAARELQTDPTNGPVLMRLAFFDVRCKLARDAMELIRKAESFGADDLDSQVVKARIYESLGNRRQALATLSKCFERGLTTFEVAVIPDFQALRRDPGYLEMVSGQSGTTKAGKQG